MPDRQVDPSRLEGNALARWYRRSPQEIEHERQQRSVQRHAAFFGPAQDQDSEKGVAFVDRRGAEPGDDALFIEIGNPWNPKLVKQYEREKGPWPYTEDGRPYDVSHIQAIADGGTNTLDNIEPMHPDEHKAKHFNDGDSKRWGVRSWIARTFGGKVEPPAHAPKRGGGPTARALGPLGILSGATGMLSGRIRTDNLDNFAADMMGLPSAEDHRKATEQFQKQINPKWKPGDPKVI